MARASSFTVALRLVLSFCVWDRLCLPRTTCLAGRQRLSLAGGLLGAYLEKVVGEQLLGVLVAHLRDVAEVGVAPGLREPGDRLADLLLTERRLAGHDAALSKGVNERGKAR